MDDKVLRDGLRHLADRATAGERYVYQLTPEQATAVLTEFARLRAIERDVNTPHTEEFLQAVRLEAAHQRQRWAADHDAGKTDPDWFWLVGYLAGKALHKPEKQLHHIITTTAALLNWHAAKTGNDTRMRPGIAPPKEDQ